MNKWQGIGRLTRDPDIRYTQSNEPITIARYTLAVDRKYKKDGEQKADFISCVAIGKNGDFAEKYLRKGMKIGVSGRIQTGSYEKDGTTIYTTDVIVEEHDFCESKGESNGATLSTSGSNDGFVSIPDGIDEELPFA